MAANDVELPEFTGQKAHNEIYAWVKETIVAKTLNFGKLIELIPRVMELANDYPKFSGADKRRLVIDIMVRAASDQKLVARGAIGANDIDKVSDIASRMIEISLDLYNHTNINLKSGGSCCF